jgi:hypothetical protein
MWKLSERGSPVPRHPHGYLFQRVVWAARQILVAGPSYDPHWSEHRPTRRGPQRFFDRARVENGYSLTRWVDAISIGR